MHIKYLSIFFIFSSIISLIIQEGYNSKAIFLVLINIILRVLLIQRISISRNLNALIVWLYTEFSFYVFIPAYVLIKKSDPNISMHVFNFGQLCVLATIFTLLTLNKFIKPLKAQNIVSYSPPPARRIIELFIFTVISAFSLSVISYVLNISQMGVPHPKLPYKIEPMLNLSRSFLVPISFCLLIHYFRELQRNTSIIILTYISWLILELFIRGSRGVVVTGLLPIILYYLKVHGAKLPKKPVLLSIPILLSSFIIGSEVRYIHKYGRMTNISSTKILSQFWNMYKRVFNEINIFKDFFAHFKIEFIQFKLRSFETVNGLNEYYTHVIKGYPFNASHSQGITALSDGLANFGLLGCIFTIFIICLMSILNDTSRLPFFNTNKATKALFIFQIWIFLIWGEGLWDFFYYRSILTVSVLPIGILLINKCFHYYLFWPFHPRKITSTV